MLARIQTLREDPRPPGSEKLSAQERYGDTAQNGFQALAEYDDNGDGAVDGQDAAYGALQVWRDLNGNGRSDPGELQALADAGVVSISTGYSVSGEVDTYGHEHRQVGTLLLANGTASTAADVWFKVDAVWRVNAPTQRSPASRIAWHAAHPPARLTRSDKFSLVMKISTHPAYKLHVKACTA